MNNGKKLQDQEKMSWEEENILLIKKRGFGTKKDYEKMVQYKEKRLEEQEKLLWNNKIKMHKRQLENDD